MSTLERTIQAITHGRYLVASPGTAPEAAIVGFHGYGENAQIQMERLQSMEGSDGRLLISIQGLHRFYRGGSDEVVASWMTRQDRESAIADNISYVGRVVESVLAEFGGRPPLLFAGFSQGVSMAFRAAVASTVQPVAVVAVGGDLPPELPPDVLKRLTAVMLCRGVNDSYYGVETFRADQARLYSAGVDARALEFPCAHSWPRELDEILPRFMRECFARFPAE